MFDTRLGINWLEFGVTFWLEALGATAGDLGGCWGIELPLLQVG